MTPNVTWQINALMRDIQQENTGALETGFHSTIRAMPKDAFPHFEAKLSMVQLLEVLKRIRGHQFETRWAFIIDDVFVSDEDPRHFRFSFESDRDMVTLRMLAGEAIPL